MYDLARLDDTELELLEQLLSKAAGDHDDVVVPTIRIERVIVDAGEPTAIIEKRDYRR